MTSAAALVHRLEGLDLSKTLLRSTVLQRLREVLPALAFDSVLTFACRNDHLGLLRMKATSLEPARPCVDISPHDLRTGCQELFESLSINLRR